MSKGLEALEKIDHTVCLAFNENNNALFNKDEYEHIDCKDIDEFVDCYNIIEKELEVLEILKAFDFEIEDYTEELNGSVCVKQRRIILDPEEIDLIKKWLER